MARCEGICEGVCIYMEHQYVLRRSSNERNVSFVDEMVDGNRSGFAVELVCVAKETSRIGVVCSTGCIGDVTVAAFCAAVGWGTPGLCSSIPPCLPCAGAADLMVFDDAATVSTVVPLIW